MTPRERFDGPPEARRGDACVARTEACVAPTGGATTRGAGATTGTHCAHGSPTTRMRCPNGWHPDVDIGRRPGVRGMRRLGVGSGRRVRRPYGRRNDHGERATRASPLREAQRRGERAQRQARIARTGGQRHACVAPMGGIPTWISAGAPASVRCGVSAWGAGDACVAPTGGASTRGSGGAPASAGCGATTWGAGDACVAPTGHCAVVGGRGSRGPRTIWPGCRGCIGGCG